MTIKTEVLPAQKKKEEEIFPVLKSNTNDDSYVVLFTGPTEGTVVHRNPASYGFQLGFYSIRWTNCNEPCWKTFEGTILLKQGVG